MPRLTGLTIGSLELTPAFSSTTYNYTCTTTNASNKVTATPDGGVELALTLNGVDFENGTSATWEEGENTLVIKATEGTATKDYTVVVTKE